MTFVRLLIATLLSAGVSSTSLASDRYIGVETCAASSCHGSKSARDNRNVSQNEYTTWFRFGQHSRSLQTLHSDAAKNITQTLGQAWPWENNSCLSCHSNNVAENLRSASYSEDDGISCEACHGPAEKWVSTHHRGESLGAQPRSIWQPENEAATCLSCHSPSASKPMTHEMFAAGHPPLSFELVAFSQMQPAHVAYDADYEKRKAKPADLVRWFSGQVARTKNYLARLEKHIPASSALVPDGTLFTCHSCHQTATRPQPLASSNPGALQPDTSSIQMISMAAEAANWQHSARLKREISQWTASASESKSTFLSNTGKLWQTIKKLNDDQRFITALASDKTKQTLRGLLSQQVADGQFKYWANAEQAYYLLLIADPSAPRQGLLSSLSAPDQFDATRFQAEFSEID